MTREELELVMDYLKQGDTVSAILDAEIAENGDKYIGTDTFTRINELSEAIMHSEELKEAILENIDDGVETSQIMHRVTSKEELNKLNDFTIEFNHETENENHEKGTNFVLKSEIPCGGYVYQNLLISADGGLYISDLY